MHTRGIAHGDAFLFNAVWTEGDQAYWVDLGAIARTDEVATASDVFTFWQFGVLGSLPATNAPREAMEYLAELASLPETERLAGLTRLPSFKGRAEPVTAEEPLQLAVTSLSRTPSHHAVAARALSIYYRAFRWNEAAAIRLDQQRALEQARHVIAEREMQRVLRLENNREVDRLQQQLGTIDAERIRRQEYIRQLELKVEELSAENVARGRYLGTLESRVEALAGIDSKRREYLAELEARIQALSEQDTERKKYLAGMERSLHDARQLANDRAEYIARLERNLAAVSDNNEKRGAYIEKLQKQLGERA